MSNEGKRWDGRATTPERSSAEVPKPQLQGGHAKVASDYANQKETDTSGEEQDRPVTGR